MEGRAHWSNGARSAKFFFMPAITILFIALIVLFPSWKTLFVGLSGITMTCYIYLIKKTTFRAFLRSLKVWLSGVSITTGSVLKIFRK